MKLFIINGEKNDEKVEIKINEYFMVKDIKNKLDEILHENGNFLKYYFILIHKNIILCNNNSIKFYKISENDEIWFGKIENYLAKDDIIIDVFISGHISCDEYLIVKINDTISTIRSIIERIYSEIINIWNADGKHMKNDQIFTEVCTNENYKLIIRCDDGERNQINNTFDQCCYLYNRQIVDRYFFTDQIRDDNKNESTKTLVINLIDQLKKIISSNDTIDDKLNQNLSEFPTAFFFSTYFFCIDMTDRILDMFNDYFKFVMNQYQNDSMWIFCQYFLFAIRAALWDYSKIRQLNNNKTNKSLSDILIDALEYLVKYLIDTSKDWRYWLRLWMNQYSLRSYSDFDLNERVDEITMNKFTIKMRVKGKDRNNFIQFKPETIIEAKQAISALFYVDWKHLYCIKPGGDYKPNDEDRFDDEFIIEIVLNMDDIEILRSLGRGAFARIYLCRDKISNKQFVLKKPIQNDGDLCRDINIYSKLNLSKNIMNYSGLFRDEESICIAMKYMSEGSLRYYLNKKKHLSEKAIVKISYEILIQINELHKLGIIHRDIKSDNIVIDENNRAKLIDFGISKYSIGLTSKDLLDKWKGYDIGTICYMAPELIKEEPYSEKIDIWSFGMVTVEMVTGKRPFHWLTPVQIILKITDCTKYEFEPIFPISNELNKFINFCLNMNPDERPSADQLIKSKLFNEFLN